MWQEDGGLTMYDCSKCPARQSCIAAAQPGSVYCVIKLMQTGASKADMESATPRQLPDFCTTSVDVCDERIATALADSGKTPSCPICGKKTICSLYEFQSHENQNIIGDVRWK